MPKPEGESKITRRGKDVFSEKVPTNGNIRKKKRARGRGNEILNESFGK